MFQVEEYIAFDEKEQSFRKYFKTVDEKTGKLINSGDVVLSDGELMEMYAENPEEALKDDRMPYLLKQFEEPSVEEPSQLDRIETALNELAAGSVSTSAVDEAITEGVNDV